MTPEEEQSPLEKMRRTLYAPKPVDGLSRDTLRVAARKEPEHWTPEPVKAAPKGPKISGTALFLGGSLAFFVIAAGITGVMLFLGGRSVSPDKVSITIEDGLTAVSSGEPASIHVLIRNENPVAITGAVLRAEFPDGTGEPEDPSKELPYYEEELGDIPAGASVRRTVAASFFGTEDQTLTIPISIEYGTGSSNATFVAKEEYAIVISSSPLLLSITTLSEVTPGQPLTLVLAVRSNSTIALDNVAVRAEGRPYPFGFVPTKTEPAQDGALFYLGTLAPGEEREIRITGTLAGQEGEERVFRFTAGTLKSEGSRDFSVAYTEKEATVALAKPFFSVGLSLNREEGETLIVSAGEPIVGFLSWENAFSSTIEDGRITVAIAGEAFDASGVDTANGFYQSSNRTVRFDRDTAAGLARLSPGDTGNGSFTFRTKSAAALAALRTPSVTLDVSVSGRRVGAGAVAETVTSTVRKTVKVRTDLGLSMRTLRTVGSIENSGAWPPVAEQETTYTIELEASNSVNSVAGTVVRATLPSYVRFTGAVSPAGTVKYSESTREVSWTIGDFAAGTTAKAAFQIAFLPSVSQKGTSPALVSDAVIRGRDRFVQEDVQGSARAVDIQAPADPAYQSSYGTVQ